MNPHDIAALILLGIAGFICVWGGRRFYIEDIRQ